MKVPYQINPNIVMPRNRRQVYCPVEDCNERVVSDLIPVDAITSSWPVIGETTYGTIDYVNKPVDNFFEDFVLRAIRPEGDLFSRLVFSRDIKETANDFSNPYKVEWSFDDHSWPMVLRGFSIEESDAFPIAVRTPDGGTVFAPRHFKKDLIKPDVDEGSRFRHEYFIHTEPPNIPLYPTPQPGAISFDYLDIHGEYPRVLHGRVVVPPSSLGRAKLLQGQTTELGSGLAGQVFEATLFEDWQPYVRRHTVSKEDVIYISTRVTVFPPIQPEDNIR